MKNKTLLLLLFCAVPVTALWEGGPSLQVDKTVPGTAFLLPKIDTDFSDLDVRDAQNRPIQTPTARQELETLFRENLVNLTVFISPHVFTEALSWIDSFSHLFNKSIFARLVVVVGLFQDAFLPPNRRFVHNVHNLCTTLFVGIFLTFSLLSIRPTSTSACRLILRC